MKKYPILILSVFMLLFSCKKDDSEIIVIESKECFVQIGDNWELVTLEQPPIYLDGGDLAFRRKMTMNVKYPIEARENGFEGIAIVQYEITTIGSVENITIVQDPGGGIGAETKKVVENATQGIVFSPGVLNGVPVRVRKEFDLNFCLK